MQNKLSKLDNEANSRSRDISFERDSFYYNYRASGIFIDQNKILLQKVGDSDILSLPGGRIKLGESGAEALSREISEEFEILLDVGQLMFIVELFFDHKGLIHHELGLYYRVHLTSNICTVDFGPKTIKTDGYVISFNWYDISLLKSLPFFPRCLATAVVEQGNYPIHLIERD